MSDIASSAATGCAKEYRIAEFLPLIATLLLAVALRISGHLDTDVSWLLTLGEKVLDGARPYVDFVEVNPPASILLYLPAVWLAHATNTAPETVVVIMVFAAAFISVGCSAWLLRKAKVIEPREQPSLAAMAVLILLALPLYTFAQREHIALLLSLPMLSLYIARAHGQSVAAPAAALVGLAAGMAVAIKPYFALAFALPFLFLLWQARRDRTQLVRLVLAPENLTAVGTAAAYVFIVFWKFPTFMQSVMPLLQTIYMPAVRTIWTQFLNPNYRLFALAGILAALLAGPRLREPLYAVPVLAAFGFLLAVLLQGKGWPYHGYPAISLLAIVVGILLLRGINNASHIVSARVLQVMCGCLLGAIAIWFRFTTEQPAVEEAVARYPISHPRILTISPDISLGHPLTRHVHGSWAGTYCSLWVADDAEYLLQKRHPAPESVKAINHYKTLARQVLVHDLRVNKPDIVLVDGDDWRKWAMSDAAIRSALAPYRADRKVGKVEIWVRKTRA